MRWRAELRSGRAVRRGGPVGRPGRWAGEGENAALQPLPFAGSPDSPIPIVRGPRTQARGKGGGGRRLFSCSRDRATARPGDRQDGLCAYALGSLFFFLLLLLCPILATALAVCVINNLWPKTRWEEERLVGVAAAGLGSCERTGTREKVPASGSRRGMVAQAR